MPLKLGQIPQTFAENAGDKGTRDDDFFKEIIECYLKSVKTGAETSENESEEEKPQKEENDVTEYHVVAVGSARFHLLGKLATVVAEALPDKDFAAVEEHTDKEIGLVNFLYFDLHVAPGQTIRFSFWFVDKEDKIHDLLELCGAESVFLLVCLSANRLWSAMQETKKHVTSSSVAIDTHLSTASMRDVYKIWIRRKGCYYRLGLPMLCVVFQTEAANISDAVGVKAAWDGMLKRDYHPDAGSPMSTQESPRGLREILSPRLHNVSTKPHGDNEGTDTGDSASSDLVQVPPRRLLTITAGFLRQFLLPYGGGVFIEPVRNHTLSRSAKFPHGEKGETLGVASCIREDNVDGSLSTLFFRKIFLYIVFFLAAKDDSILRKDLTRWEKLVLEGGTEAEGDDAAGASSVFQSPKKSGAAAQTAPSRQAKKTFISSATKSADALDIARGNSGIPVVQQQSLKSPAQHLWHEFMMLVKSHKNRCEKDYQKLLEAWVKKLPRPGADTSGRGNQTDVEKESKTSGHSSAARQTAGSDESRGKSLVNITPVSPTDTGVTEKQDKNRAKDVTRSQSESPRDTMGVYNLSDWAIFPMDTDSIDSVADFVQENEVDVSTPFPIRKRIIDGAPVAPASGSSPVAVSHAVSKSPAHDLALPDGMSTEDVWLANVLPLPDPKRLANGMDAQEEKIAATKTAVKFGGSPTSPYSSAPPESEAVTEQRVRREAFEAAAKALGQRATPDQPVKAKALDSFLAELAAETEREMALEEKARNHFKQTEKDVSAEEEKAKAKSSKDPVLSPDRIPASLISVKVINAAYAKTQNSKNQAQVMKIISALPSKLDPQVGSTTQTAIGRLKSGTGQIPAPKQPISERLAALKNMRKKDSAGDIGNLAVRPQKSASNLVPRSSEIKVLPPGVASKTLIGGPPKSSPDDGKLSRPVSVRGSEALSQAGTASNLTQRVTGSTNFVPSSRLGASNTLQPGGGTAEAGGRESASVASASLARLRELRKKQESNRTSAAKPDSTRSSLNVGNAEQSGPVPVRPEKSLSGAERASEANRGSAALSAAERLKVLRERMSDRNK